MKMPIETMHYLHKKSELCNEASLVTLTSEDFVILFAVPLSMCTNWCLCFHPIGEITGSN